MSKISFLLLILVLFAGCSPKEITPATSPTSQVAPKMTSIPSKIVTLSNDTPVPETPTPSPIVTPAIGPNVILQGDGTVNLRSGPGSLWPIVGRFENGTKFTAIAQSEHGEWLLLSSPEIPGGTAWVYAAYTNYKTDLNPLPIATPAQPVPQP